MVWVGYGLGLGALNILNSWYISLLSGSVQFLGAELKETPDETLFLELARRGYDLSSLRPDDETTAEIIKIG